jgi:hypothetical protein
MARPLRAVGRHRYIPTGSSQLDQGSKRAGTSTRARPTNCPMPESGNDPRNDLSIAMLAD